MDNLELANWAAHEPKSILKHALLGPQLTPQGKCYDIMQSRVTSKL